MKTVTGSALLIFLFGFGKKYDDEEVEDEPKWNRNKENAYNKASDQFYVHMNHGNKEGAKACLTTMTSNAQGDQLIDDVARKQRSFDSKSWPKKKGDDDKKDEGKK